MKKMIYVLLLSGVILQSEVYASEQSPASQALEATGKAAIGSIIPITNDSDAKYPIWVTIKSQSTVGRVISKITHAGGAIRYDYKHIKGNGDSYTFTATGNRVVIRTTICRGGSPKEIEKEHTKGFGYKKLNVRVNPNAAHDRDVITVTES